MTAFAASTAVTIGTFEYALVLLHESKADVVEVKADPKRRTILLTQPTGRTALMIVRRPGPRPFIKADVLQAVTTPTDVFRFLGRIGVLRAGTRMPAFMEP